MASLDEADKTAKEARSGLFVRPYENQDVILVLQLGVGGLFIREQWYNKAEKRPMKFTAADKEAGRTMDMPSFNVSCAVLEYDPKDRRNLLSVQKKIASLNSGEYTDAKKIYEEKSRDGKNGWERCVLIWSLTMVKGKKKTDIRYSDYIDEVPGLRAKMGTIVPFSEDELKSKSLQNEGSEDTHGGGGAGSDSTELVSAATAEAIAGRIKNLPNVNEDAAAFKVKFNVQKVRELRQNQVSAAEAWISEREKPNGAGSSVEL